eukprot:UN04131
MSQINLISNHPIAGINVKVIRTSDLRDASLNADIASENTRNQIDRSKLKIQDFRYKTNERIERIDCKQSECHQQRQSQLKENLNFLLNDSLQLQNKKEFNKTFATLFPANTSKISTQKKQKKMIKLKERINGVNDTNAMSRSKSIGPWWEK